MNTTSTLQHFLAQSDGVGQVLFLILITMSVASWYFILSKVWKGIRMHRRSAQYLTSFWNAFSLEQIAGPVGEALIMTGLGLAVAIPAVLSYNACARSNRLVLAKLDAFAHDLFALITVGAKANSSAGETRTLRVVGQREGGL